MDAGEMLRFGRARPLVNAIAWGVAIERFHQAAPFVAVSDRGDQSTGKPAWSSRTRLHRLRRRNTSR